ncbi:MAG TPA: alpha-amylase family glycosyl hydrolase [Acidiferrobacteraceae bacterium]|nr:alpha-amylase family glycosyl hydrolase [Acidiferrobacteraceae bacterium]
MPAKEARHRSHLSFGAEYTPDGTTFRLWAPGIATVHLELYEDAPTARTLVMERQADGSHVCCSAVAPGTPYCYRLPGARAIPDPASRAQLKDADGLSLVVDPTAYLWSSPDWTGRPWEDAVIYELHLGSFTHHAPGAAFQAARSQLEALASLGVTAIELMPVADFPGRWNWGYDGVLPYAPDRAYGTPDDLKALVDTAHQHHLMVFLDVVYNHFGPEACFLREHVPDAFTRTPATPWGPALTLAQSSFLRRLLLDNARYWIEEFQMDGLRLDAPQHIHDSGSPHFLVELADRVQEHSGGRIVHLMLEHAPAPPAPGLPAGYVARWHDPLHHAAHVILSGETSGYYQRYAEAPVATLAAAIEQAGNPATAIVFLQNHDQIGNRPWGDRLAAGPALQALLALILLAPFRPLLFMGEETGTTTPFPFFCDFPAPLAAAVAQGRRREFAAFPEFSGSMADPSAESTFESARLRHEPTADAAYWRAYYQKLLRVRAARIHPLLPGAGTATHARMHGTRALSVAFPIASGALRLYANLGPEPADIPVTAGAVLYASEGLAAVQPAAVTAFPAWSVLWVQETGAPA